MNDTADRELRDLNISPLFPPRPFLFSHLLFVSALLFRTLLAPLHSFMCANTPAPHGAVAELSLLDYRTKVREDVFAYEINRCKAAFPPGAML